jgi:hypothetical protein
MQFELKDLVPIVAKLTENYTLKESTSITYEKAQQLMDAVVYCIRECETSEQYSLIQEEELSAWKMYETGARCVEEKVKKSLELYNKIMTEFLSYDNECLYDTVAKGLPEFFKWYDYKFEPQNSLLTLDYPVLAEVSEHTGIDRIYDFLVCILIEQKFLNKFPYEFVIKVLSEYDNQYKSMIDNLCEIVLMYVVIHILSGNDFSHFCLETGEYQHLQSLIQEKDLSELREIIKNVIKTLVREHYENDGNLWEYLCLAVDNISVRIKNAADYGNIQKLFC